MILQKITDFDPVNFQEEKGPAVLQYVWLAMGIPVGILDATCAQVAAANF
jgi:hypothetical protein